MDAASSHPTPWFNRWYLMAAAAVASLAFLGMLFRGLLAVAAQAEAVPSLERRFVAESAATANLQRDFMATRSRVNLVAYILCVQLRKHDPDLLPPDCEQVPNP
ncbi:MAG TPA: hypothetical protein VKU35_01360 [Candidatus Limnocylindria bacterium]|nr:hypothetical protein [Candidatus Limnocylindria bacterium]